MMKSKLLRNVMMCALTASLVIAPVMGSNAAITTSGGGAITEDSGNKGGGGGGGNGTNAPAAPAIATTSSVQFGGTTVKSTIDGQYSASNVAGVAVATPKAELSAALGLAKGEKAFVKVFKSSYGPKAQETVKAAAAGMGVPVGPVLDITMGKMSAKGSFTNVGNTAIPVAFTVGVPKSFAQDGCEYAVIRVMEGGAVTVLPDIDADPNTVTFATEGFGVFAMVKAPVGTFTALQ